MAVARRAATGARDRRLGQPVCVWRHVPRRPLPPGPGQLPRPLFGYDGAVAARDCDDIGETVWLRPVGAEDWERFIVADCAGVADGGYAWMVRLGVLVEVDYQTAKRWGCIGRLMRVEMKR